MGEVIALKKKKKKAVVEVEHWTTPFKPTGHATYVSAEPGWHMMCRRCGKDWGSARLDTTPENVGICTG